MELKQFIKTALADITNAVKESQEELNNGAVVSPEPVPHLGPPEYQDICFDVAVTVMASTSGGKGVNFALEVVGLKLGTENSDKSEAVTRLSFKIPVSFPVGKEPGRMRRNNIP